MNGRIRLAISVLATFFILFHGRWSDIVFAFVSPTFYIAFAASFGICLLMVTIIHRISLWLDRHYDWKHNLLPRAVLQFGFGIIFPLVIDLILISIYFGVQGRGLVDSGFLLADFPIIASFVIVLNVYYLIHYLIVESGWFQGQKNIALNNGRFMVDYNGYYASLDIAADIFCLHREGKRMTVITLGGTNYVLRASLGELEEQFARYNFYRINRSILINGQVIEGFQRGHKRETHQLIIKAQYADLARALPREYFWVSAEYQNAFKSSFKRPAGSTVL